MGQKVKIKTIRWLISVAAILFGVCFFSTKSFAATEYDAANYNDLISIIDSAPAGEEVVINVVNDMDITDRLPLKSYQNITINGGGHTLRQTESYLGKIIHTSGSSPVVDYSFVVRDLVFHGAASDWSAQWGEDANGLPAIDTTDRSTMTGLSQEQLLYFDRGDLVVFENVVFENFASVEVEGADDVCLLAVSADKIELKNNVFRHNFRIDNLLFAGQKDGSDIVVIDGNVFHDNVTHRGMGISLAGSNDSNSFKDNSFIGNWAYIALLDLIFDLSDGPTPTTFKATNTTISANNSISTLVRVSPPTMTAPTLYFNALRVDDNVVNNVAKKALGMIFLQDTNAVFSQSQITANHGVSFGGSVALFAENANENIYLNLSNNTKIADNRIDYSEAVANYLSDDESVSFGAGILVANTTTDRSSTLSVDNTVSINNNEAPAYGFGDDIAVIGVNDLDESIRLVGLEKIAEWHLDNFKNRYDQKTSTPLSNLPSIKDLALNIKLSGLTVRGIGLKAASITQALPAKTENPNTSDVAILATLTALMTTICITVVAYRAYHRRVL